MCRHGDPLVRAVGTRCSELNPFVRAALCTVLTDMPYPAVRGDVDVPDVVVAESVGRVVVDEVLLLLHSRGKTPVVVANNLEIQMQGLERTVATAVDEAVGLCPSVHEGPHVGERLLQVSSIGLGITGGRGGLGDTVSLGGNVRLTGGGIKSSEADWPLRRHPGPEVDQEQHKQSNEEDVGARLDVDLRDGLVEDHRIGVVPPAAISGRRQDRGGSKHSCGGLRPRKLVRALRALRGLLLAARLVGLVSGDLVQVCPQTVSKELSRRVFGKSVSILTSGRHPSGLAADLLQLVPGHQGFQTSPLVGGGRHVQLLAVQDVIEALRINDKYTRIEPLETSIRSVNAVASIQDGSPKGHHEV